MFKIFIFLNFTSLFSKYRLKKNGQKVKKFDIVKGPYPWIQFPSEENPLKRKFREAIVINQQRYIDNIKGLVATKTFDMDLVKVNRRMQHIPTRITKSLYDEDPKILSSGARLNKKVSETFGDFVSNMTQLFEHEEKEKKEVKPSPNK